MPVGSGLSASLGFATETTVGTPVPVTRFVEFDSESLTQKKHTYQGAGLRQGGLVKRAARRGVVGREAAGDVNFDVATNGLGVLLQHMLGSFTATATSVGGGLYKQVHSLGSLQGKSFTTQVLRPDTTGVLAAEAFTYPGCKITDWELSVASEAQLKAKLSIDALDEATPSNGFAATVLSASVAAAATSITTAASIPAGSYVVLDAGAAAEVVQTGTPTGSGPYTIPITTTGGVKNAHASGAYVGSATGVNYGAATALQTAAYQASSSLFDFSQGQVIAGGTVTTSSGAFTVAGGQTVATVKSFSITAKRALKTDRWAAGQKTRNEQLENGFIELKASAEIDYTGRAFYDAYAADLPLALQFPFTTASGAALSIVAPAAFLNDGATPNVGGPDVLSQKLDFDLLDDGTNGAIQAVYTSTDSTL